MGPRRSLRLRVAIGFASLGAALSMLLSVSLWFAARDVSQRLMDQTLRAELEDYMARHARNPGSLPPATASLRGYYTTTDAAITELPPPLRQLAPGQHEIDLDGIPYRVAVADEHGRRYVILFDEVRQKHREQRFLAYLVIGALTMTLFAASGGWWLAGRVIAPVTELARAVTNARPDEPPPLLSIPSAGTPGDEVDDLARAFERYLMRLRLFVERERSFAADASHELRTPLTVIRGAVDVIAAKPGLDPELRERLARIERASEEMTQLVEALLLLAREDEPAAGEACDARHIARQCIERYRGQATARGTVMTLTATSPVTLAAPPALFAIVLANLVRNAIAHTLNGRIAITLEATSLTVRDNGSGIEEAEQQRVFERLYRGTDSEGAGIGLFLVQRICDRLGWTASLQSDAPAGTRIDIRFRAA
ncbi:MAG: HAMP domain-containing histidine kinase [Rhodocyclales bacterium]|nr:HAMP domain-containing histidine kinase [Rhodocyclales bacterium]